MREQSNNFNTHLQQKQTAGLPAVKAVQRIFRVMALVRGAYTSKLTGMHRGIPLLGAMPAELLKSTALRITSMPVASAPLFSEQDREPQPIRPTSRGFDGLLACSMYWSLNEKERRAGTISPLKRKNC